MFWSQNGQSGSTHKIALCTDDDDDFMRIDNAKQLFHQAYASFNDLRTKCQLCDVVLVMEGRKLSAHKVVLAAAIPYFRLMFTTDMIESNMKEIQMNDVEYNTMDQLLSFAYTGELRITTSNVQSLMMGASFLQLQEVVNQGAQFLISRLHFSNVLSIRTFCQTVGCTSDVIARTTSFIQKHFLAVSHDDEFQRLDFDNAVDFLSFDELYVNSEEDIFMSAVAWLQHEESRKIFAADILKCVRLPLLSPSFLADVVATHPLMRNDIACRDLIDEAKDYHLIPERRLQLKSFRVEPRVCHEIPGFIFAIGGLLPDVKTVEMFDPTTKKWTVAKEMSKNRSRVGVAVHNRHVFAVGGFDGQDRLKLVEVYDYDKDTWTKLAPLQRKRSALVTAIHGSKLYVCGGYDGMNSLDSVEVYDIEKKQWEDGPNMLKQRSASGVAVLDGYIYVIGGHDGMSIFSSVERLNIETKTWEAVPSMISKRCRLGATAYKGKIYACGGFDGNNFLRSVEVLDLETMQWSFVSSMNMCRSRVSLAANNDGLYAVAGFDGEFNLCSVEVYDDVNDSWSLTTPLSIHEGGVGVGVIPIPPHMLTS